LVVRAGVRVASLPIPGPSFDKTAQITSIYGNTERLRLEYVLQMTIDAKQVCNFITVEAIDKTKGPAKMIVREEALK
jgi:hypothetical protein